MTSILTSHSCIRSTGTRQQNSRRRLSEVISPGSVCPSIPSTLSFSSRSDLGHVRQYYGVKKKRTLCSSSIKDLDPQNPEDENPGDESSSTLGNGGGNSERFRANLERTVGADDSTFSGIDLATLIRKKYGRSYDVQFIKKEFMGRNLLALNVMWKYMEQKSFPLTEEEYILRLDDVANSLRCWGAVSHIRNSLASSKERPRIGKAVSIFIDMDESGGRSNEWIYK